MKDSNTHIPQCSMPESDSASCVPQINVDSINSNEIKWQLYPLCGQQKTKHSHLHHHPNRRRQNHQKEKPCEFYAGCPTAEIFMFIVVHVRPKHSKLQYYRGSTSNNNKTKKYQINPVTKFSLSSL